MTKTFLATIAALVVSVTPVFAYTCELETVFTPFDNGTQTYLDYVGANAKSSLYVSVYTMTSQPLVDEYCRLASNGVTVKILVDKMQTKAVKKEMALIKQLRDAGVEVTITTSPIKHAIMHNKFSICDGQYVIDGSFNYTLSADLQCNTLSFNTTPCIPRAKLYRDAWDKIYLFANLQNSKVTTSKSLVSSVELHRETPKNGKHRHRRFRYSSPRRDLLKDL